MGGFTIGGGSVVPKERIDPFAVPAEFEVATR
jgi:hypothetical protein